MGWGDLGIVQVLFQYDLLTQVCEEMGMAETLLDQNVLDIPVRHELAQDPG